LELLENHGLLDKMNRPEERTDFLQKPFTAQALLNAVRRLIGKTGGHAWTLTGFSEPAVGRSAGRLARSGDFAALDHTFHRPLQALNSPGDFLGARGPRVRWPATR
jgi:hypothetical protein